MEKYAYTLYGKPAAASTLGNPYMYTGRRLDAETGLYYYRARYYEPNLRRFIETDPIGYAGGMNLYAYVRNSPVNCVDPWGLWAVWGGGNVALAFGPWGYNAGAGKAFDSSNKGDGVYFTRGPTEGFAASGTAEIGFFTGSMSGHTETIAVSIFGVTIGAVSDDKGNWGVVGGYSIGAPAEGNISNNDTDFYSYYDMGRDLRRIIQRTATMNCKGS